MVVSSVVVSGGGVVSSVVVVLVLVVREAGGPVLTSLVVDGPVECGGWARIPVSTESTRKM